jgi:hypothetical protein
MNYTSEQEGPPSSYRRHLESSTDIPSTALSAGELPDAPNAAVTVKHFQLKLVSTTPYQ